jgi:hypothetical protein
MHMPGPASALSAPSEGVCAFLTSFCMQNRPPRGFRGGRGRRGRAGAYVPVPFVRTVGASISTTGGVGQRLPGRPGFDR